MKFKYIYRERREEMKKFYSALRNVQKKLLNPT